MECNKFEYFLNAVHYSLWLNDINFGNYMGKVVDKQLSLIFKYPFTKEQKKRYNERRLKEQKKADKFLYDKETGWHIESANHWFGYFYSCYPAFLSFLLLGTIFRLCKDVNYLTILLTASIPVCILYIPAYKAVFEKDRYLEYFKQFKKEDEYWHRKWRHIAMMFCISAVVTALFGIAVMWSILLM